MTLKGTMVTKSTPLHTESEQKPKTFGQEYVEGIQKDSGHAPVKDIRDGILTDWDKNVIELIEKTRKVEPNRHFYICISTKREQLLNKVIRNYFESKYECPTPQFEQAVYKVHANSDQPMLMWVIPNKDACIYLKNNAQNVAPDEHALLNWVLLFAQGKLDQWAQLENGELVEKLN